MSRRSWREGAPSPGLPAPSSDPARPLIQAEEAARVERALSELAPRDRLILRLAEVEGLPHARIAQALGVEAPSVSALLGRARGRLRERFGR